MKPTYRLFHSKSDGENPDSKAETVGAGHVYTRSCTLGDVPTGGVYCIESVVHSPPLYELVPPGLQTTSLSSS